MPLDLSPPSGLARGRWGDGPHLTKNDHTLINYHDFWPRLWIPAQECRYAAVVDMVNANDGWLVACMAIRTLVVFPEFGGPTMIIEDSFPNIFRNQGPSLAYIPEMIII